ncbi:MAG: SCO family protein [Candidatus Latescibacterota bacterium]|nr:SCO family protein [Candidatus Latescibacterota bacterium]
MAAKLTKERIDKIDFEQRLGEKVSPELTFRDHNGIAVRLGDFLGDKPIILSLVYYECPLLCGQVLNSLLRSLNVLNFDIGTEYDVISVSIDPNESPDLAAEKKQAYIEKYRGENAEKGWNFWVGDQDQIDKIASSVGFKYEYDSETDQYVHASGIIVLTPDGQIARYFYGLDYPPRDLRWGLVEASKGKIGNPVDELLLLCYSYDPLTGEYGIMIMNALRIGSVLAMLSLATFVFVMLRRERRKSTPLSTQKMEPR